MELSAEVIAQMLEDTSLSKDDKEIISLLIQKNNESIRKEMNSFIERYQIADFKFK